MQRVEVGVVVAWRRKAERTFAPHERNESCRKLVSTGFFGRDGEDVLSIVCSNAETVRKLLTGKVSDFAECAPDCVHCEFRSRGSW